MSLLQTMYQIERNASANCTLWWHNSPQSAQC